MSFELRGFYGVVSLDGDCGGEAAGVTRALALGEQLVAGGAQVLQVRLKHAPVRTLHAVARALRELTRRAGVPFVVNDRLDVALAVDADGVHLGQDDLPLDAARAALRQAGRQLVVGVSTHSPGQAEAAARAGADYLGFGPVYATATKQNPDPVQGVDALAQAVARARPVPIVAIGGITLARVGEVAAAGAAAACVIAAVNGAADVASAARTVGAAFARR